jgi:DNA-binding response OmpR family regulator
MRRVRARAGGKDIKIIAVTASLFGEINRDAVAAGADALILKPFRETEMFERIRAVLGAEYVYEEEAAPLRTAAETMPELEPGELDALPRELVLQLREAATLGDFNLLISLAARVETRNARLGSALCALAGKFDMQRILDLLGKE